MTPVQRVQKMLQERARIKKSKPHFVVKAASFSVRVKERWRNPRGLHSPIRQKYRGKPALVKVGYGSPKEVRGLHSSGLEPVVVHTIRDLAVVDPDFQGAVIGSGVGAKQRLALLSLAAERKMRILNVRDAAAAAARIKREFEQRQKSQKEKLHSKSKKEEEKKKNAEKKQKQTEEKKTADAKEHDHATPAHLSPEDRDAAKEEQKLMAEKMITKRQ